jgi:hypothetical protein
MNAPIWPVWVKTQLRMTFTTMMRQPVGHLPYAGHARERLVATGDPLIERIFIPGAFHYSGAGNRAGLAIGREIENTAPRVPDALRTDPVSSI